MWSRSRSSSSSQERALWSDYMEKPEKEVVDLVGQVVEETVDIVDIEYEEEQFKEFKILNYLMGKPLSPTEEAEVLHSLQTTNAACIEDLLQIINEDSEPRNPKTESGAKTSPQENFENIPSPTLSVVACMRLKIGTLELSPDGLELCQSVKQDARITSLLFLVEYLPPRSCINNTLIRISSKRICNNVVTFEQEKLHSCESSKPLEFTILIKKSGCNETVFGVASYDWTKILLSGNKCDVSLIVNHSSKNLVLGKLKIRLQIGDENAITKPHKESHHLPRRHEVSPVESRGSREPEVIHVVNEVPTERSQKLHFPQKESLLLRSLFLATASKGFEKGNLCLVLKAFWLDEDYKSPISAGKDENFNFNMTAPILLSPYFLSRCKGNNAILEVWHVTDDGDELVGITLLPLHTFYLAYHDMLVTKALLDCKLPVISVDQWLQVVSPKSGSQVGEIMCLLAFGSDDQVTQLEIKRGLRNCDSATPSLSASNEPIIVRPPENTTCVHNMNISVLKIKGLFGAKVEAECFVECNIPSIDANASSKKLSTSEAICEVETKLNSILEYHTELPAENCLSKFFSNQSKDCITFSIFCKTNQPRCKNIKVAQAYLPLSDIEFLEDQFSISEEPAFLSLALPIKTEDAEVPRLFTNENGSLVIRIEYLKQAKRELAVLSSSADEQSSVATQTEVSEFSEKGESESGESSSQNEQLWSTTLLSQLQRLRISKTSSASKEDAPKKTFRCHVKVEKAIQLPYTKTTTDTAITHSEPCTYVTITNDGDSKMSPIVLYSIDPVWNWSCEVELPTHLLLEGAENLVLKVWQLPSCSDTPSTKSNAILCFAAVQIADLKYGLPKISGWFNLVNYSGKYCGKIYMSITPLENLPQLMFPQRGIPKQIPFVMPVETMVPVLPAEPPAPCKPNPYIDLSSSVMESTFRKQMLDFEEFTSQLKGSISDPNRKIPQIITENAIARIAITSEDVPATEKEETDDKQSSGSEGSEEESSTDTVDSDVAKLLAKFDLETLHKIVEQLDDEVTKMSHGSKPDYVCSSKAPAKVGEQKDSLVPAIEADSVSVGSHSDSGISTTARKRHLQQ